MAGRLSRAGRRARASSPARGAAALAALLACGIDSRELSLADAGPTAIDSRDLRAAQSLDCEPGRYRCRGALLQACRDDGPGFVSVERCASAALCDAEAGLCRAAACAAEELACRGARLERCNADRDGFELIATCRSPAHCNPGLGQCSDAPCTAGERRCDRDDDDASAVLEECRGEGEGWRLLSACVTRALCDWTLRAPLSAELLPASPAALGLEPSPGRLSLCRQPRCSAGEVRCEGERLQVCDEGRTGFEALRGCEISALCEAQRERCGAPACAAGEHRCELRQGMVVLTACSAGRGGFDVVAVCGPGQTCDAAGGECDVCAPGAARCEGDTLVRCDARGQREEREVCGSGLCSASARRCLPCDPDGPARCRGPELSVCTVRAGAELEIRSRCETRELCEQTLAACAPASEGSDCQCAQAACRTGELRCEGAELQRCNAGLTGFESVATCDSAALCNASTGQCSACAPGEIRCEGAEVLECSSDGGGFAPAAEHDPCFAGRSIRRCIEGLLREEPCELGCDAGASECRACREGASRCLDATTEELCVAGRLTAVSCTLGCVAGRCANCTASQCVDGARRRACVDGQLQPSTDCSDGDVCNGVEGCFEGACIAGAGPDCDDDDPCTDDRCDPLSGCAHEANEASCSDGNPCNGVEICGGGRCLAAVPPTCAEDDDPCTNAVCDPAQGCVQARRAACVPCEGNVCVGNVFVACENGVRGAATDCEQVGGFCSPASGCVR